tara:strand:- start:30 stop:314 length:285 start_codon:yes stop_codon:yes gene_type:complete
MTVKKKNIKLFIAGEPPMKFTKGKIKQLIKEEIEALAEKDGPHFHHKISAWLNDKLGPELGDLVAMCIDYAPKGHQDEIARLSDELIVLEGEEG